MQYLVSVIDDKANSGTPEEQAAIDVFNDRDHGGRRPRRGAQARRRGVEGLQPEDRGAAVPVSVADVREAITQAHHEEWARVVASLTRRLGDLDIAEEAAAEAFATAVERWPADGVPPNPGAWLTTTANRKAIDRIRRENKRDDKQKEAHLLYDDDPQEPFGASLSASTP